MVYLIAASVYVFRAWHSLPPDIVDTLYRAYRQAANAPAVLAAMERNGTTPGTRDPKEAKEMIAHEYDALHEVAERLGLAVH